mgnify:CR=1 FL=1
MAITISQLDNTGKDDDVNILLGRNLLLKFIPERSALDDNKALQDVIKTPDLLKEKGIIDELKEIRIITDDIASKLSDSIKLRELAKNLPSTDYSFFENEFKKINKKIIGQGSNIDSLKERVVKSLPKFNYLYFCRKCSSYLADSPDALPVDCSFCKEKTNWSQHQLLPIKYLDEKVRNYLGGLWLEDYIGKLLIKEGWKVWCHGYVMGSSGINHQIDILALNSKLDLCLVVECKTGKVYGSDILNFSTRYFDIKSHYGLFFALKNAPTIEKTFMEKTPGLSLIDNLEGLSDIEIIKKINDGLNIK